MDSASDSSCEGFRGFGPGSHHASTQSRSSCRPPGTLCKRRSQESWARRRRARHVAGLFPRAKRVITGSPASKTVPGCGMSPRRGTANGGGEPAGSQPSRSGRWHRAGANRISLPTTRLPGGDPGLFATRSGGPSPALRAPAPGGNWALSQSQPTARCTVRTVCQAKPSPAEAREACFQAVSALVLPLRPPLKLSGLVRPR